MSYSLPQVFYLIVSSLPILIYSLFEYKLIQYRSYRTYYIDYMAMSLPIPNAVTQFERFVAVHKVQLESIGLPIELWKVLLYIYTWLSFYSISFLLYLLKRFIPSLLCISINIHSPSMRSYPTKYSMQAIPLN